MRNLSKIAVVLLAFTLIVGGSFSCYKGSSAPSGEKTQIQAIAQSINAVDSAELLKTVQVKIDAVNSGITSVEQGQAIEKELKAIRDQAKSPDLIKKIDEIIQQIQIQIVALKNKEDIKASLEQTKKSVQALLDAISGFSANMGGKDELQKTIDSLNKFLADIQYQKELIAQLKKMIQDKAEWASAESELANLLSALAAKEAALQELLKSAVLKQKEFLSAAEIDAKITQKMDTLLVKIASILAKASEKYDANKITTAESLINSIKVTNDVAQLDMIKVKLAELESYFKQALDNLKIIRAELMAVIAETENLFKEAQAGNYSKLKILENYLASLKQANLDPDIAKLSNLISSISNAYIAIADKQRQIKENQIKEALLKEYNELKAQYDSQITSAAKILEEVNNALGQKAFIEQEIENGNFNANLITKLTDIQVVLNKSELQSIALAISELQQLVASLKARSGAYVPEITALAGLIDALDTKFDKAIADAAAAMDDISGMKDAISQGLAEINNEETPGKDEVTVSEGENQVVSELNLKNLLKFAKYQKGEIVFYKRVLEVTEKTISHKKRLKGQNGKMETVEVKKIVKVKKYNKVAYKKWKLEFVEGAKNEKKITINVYQSLMQNGSWTEYKLFGYFTLKDLWYDRLQDLIAKNGHGNWLKFLKK